VNNSTSYNTALQNTPTLYLLAAQRGRHCRAVAGFYDNQTGTGGLPYGGPENSIQGNEDLSWSRARHTMRLAGNSTTSK